MSIVSDHGLPERADTRADFAAQLRRGDPSAMRLVRERVRRIIGYRRLPIQRHEVEDLEQDVMTQLWRALNRPDFDPGAGIWGFVEVVTSRRCIDWLRSRRTLVPLSESLRDTDRDPLGKTLTLEASRIAADVLAALDEPCRQLIAMRVGQGLSFKELSVSLGRSEGALRVRMYRCVRAAREILAQLGLTHRDDEGGSP
ncbi:MAG TPA: sigma-70 family RNA polymerase sigma factor [Thermoanaerobaculia bacterium]|nr:sigma-70 family RNA polymerase sigma factor [Thermoanaerobaculia bacterium]